MVRGSPVAGNNYSSKYIEKIDDVCLEKLTLLETKAGGASGTNMSHKWEHINVSVFVQKYWSKYD